MSMSVHVGSRSSSNPVWQTMGVGTPPTLTTTHRFSGYHPVIPKRYVPQWQTDMRNRRLTIDVSYIYWYNDVG